MITFNVEVLSPDRPDTVRVGYRIDEDSYFWERQVMSTGMATYLANETRAWLRTMTPLTHEILDETLPRRMRELEYEYLRREDNPRFGYTNFHVGRLDKSGEISEVVLVRPGKVSTPHWRSMAQSICDRLNIRGP